MKLKHHTHNYPPTIVPKTRPQKIHMAQILIYTENMKVTFTNSVLFRIVFRKIYPLAGFE